MPGINAELAGRAGKRLLKMVCVLAIAFGAQAIWPGDVYSSRSIATLLAPVGGQSRTLEDSGEDPLILASVLAAAVAGPDAPPRGASPDATLYGEGKRRAISARVRDEGGQWQKSIREPILILEVVDSSAEAAHSRLQGLQDHSIRTLTRLQDELDVNPTQRASLSFTPADPEILNIRGNRSRVLVGVAAFLLVFLYVLLPALPSPRTVGSRYGRSLRLNPARAENSLRQGTRSRPESD